MSNNEEKPTDKTETEPVKDESYVLYEEPTVFSGLIQLRYFIAAYIGLFGLFLLIGLLQSDQINKQEYVAYVLQYIEVKFSDLYTWIFIMSIIALLGIVGILATQEDLSDEMGVYLNYTIGAYLVLIALSFILSAITGDYKSFVSVGFVTFGTLILGASFLFAGYQDSGMSLLDYRLKDLALGAGSIAYGISIFITGYELDGVDSPAISYFFGIQQVGSQTFTQFWILPTFHTWFFSGFLWLGIGGYFLIRGLEIDLEEKYDLLETGLLVLLSLTLLWSNLKTFFIILFGGITGLGVIILLFANLVGIYLGYMINPYREVMEQRYKEYLANRPSK